MVRKINEKQIAFLFDVDGVIVNSPHENAWKDSALELKLITEDFNFKTFYQEFVAGISGLKIGRAHV